MMRSRDPRVRQRINQISHNLESANETAQEGLYTFSHNYLVPCFAAIGNCVYACTAPCLPSREDQLRRRRRGRAEANFDFYDDWDNDESNDGLLGWGTDELDRLLAGSGLARGSSEQPRRQRKMSYGARRTRKKSTAIVNDDRNDPTVIPSSSFLGFLERLPWRFGARGLKYRPSAADLQEHPAGLLRRHDHENEPLIEETEESEGQCSGRNGRYRSSTQSSRDTINSLSSRGDLIPSDEEEDAVPLSDEFALALASRRGTGLDSIDLIGDKPSSMRSVSGTFSLRTTASSKELKQKKKKRSSRLRSPQGSYVEVTQEVSTPTLADLKKEEDQAELREESEVARRRLIAQQLASSRGLDQTKDEVSHSQPLSPQPQTVSSDTTHHESPDTPLDSAVKDGTTQSQVTQPLRNPRSPGDDSQTEPFPPFPSTPDFHEVGFPYQHGYFQNRSNDPSSSGPADPSRTHEDRASEGTGGD
ncbi:hypothetical protein BO70DRAFT_312451 [Aspergillus heteromorphus CBS 117.55]|uniref:Uncharacterized protein n=1 Tax=Aspergillus heteromorphus CBS 117.55 TaxID=1448321 RepID=A0A317WI16_9EURO|nr:uncharacterized protein BO70DRAFT_312451 [Aspergillus heteromorphus CBS 117.55]PWY86106.1 hypothetical protein BO70DRAFT_312451 [Aspergillus heteromorphus CBS 117.55]